MLHRSAGFMIKYGPKEGDVFCMKTRWILILAAAVVVAGGCQSVDLQAHGNQNPAPVVDQWCWESYWGFSWSETPQELVDRWAQKEAGGRVSTAGIFRIEVASNPLCDLLAIGSLGTVVPVNVKCWMQDDGTANVLPPTVRHKRPGR